MKPRALHRQDRRYLPASVLVSLLVASVTATASTLSVSPVRVVVVPGNDITSLTLRNGGRRAETFQIRAFVWKQGRNGSQLIPTTRLEFSPPMGTLRGGATQIVRLKVPRPMGRTEDSYRLFIDQLPPPTAIGGVTMVLRLSIPVFVEPRGNVAPAVRWRLLRHQGRLWLSAINAGGRHIVVRDLRLHGMDCRIKDMQGRAFAYVLADSIRRWPVACPEGVVGARRSVRLSMRTSYGTVTVPLSTFASKR